MTHRKLATSARLGAVVLALVLFTACDEVASDTSSASESTEVAAQVEVPNLVGNRLNVAKSALNDAGLDASSHDAVADRVQIVDSNWIVVDQDPAAGAMRAKGTKVELGVRKDSDESLPGQSRAGFTVEVTTTTLAPTTTVYVAPAPTAPRVTSPPVTSPPPTSASVYYANCDAARAAGAAPLDRGDPGYRSALDRDGDGVACE